MGLPWPFRKEVTEEEVSEKCVDSGNKLQRQKEGPWKWVQVMSPGQPAIASCSPGCKSCGDPESLGGREQRHTPEERRGVKVWACSGFFVLKVFICFQKVGILGGPQGMISVEYSLALQLCPLYADTSK